MVLSFIVLLLVLRSVVLPIKAVLMNVLSVAAAYGVLVAVFQWGWFDWTGFEHLGYVQAITPALLLAIVFGLSMDYEVFMLSRIKERYQATGDNRLAVAQGLEASAKTISSAALIMVAVFAIFAGTGVPQIKEIGVGLAVAIALDATVVRLILVPDDDGADGRLELVPAEVAGPDPARHGLRVLGRRHPVEEAARASLAGVNPVVIAGGARTPIGRFNGALAKVDAVDLGAHAVRAALERTGLEPDYVAVGNVLQAANGQNPGRRAALQGGVRADRARDHAQRRLPGEHERGRAGGGADPRRRGDARCSSAGSTR